MPAATKVKMSGSKKTKTKSEQERIRATRKFLEVSRCSRAKQRQRNVQKSVLQVQGCFLAN